MKVTKKAFLLNFVFFSTIFLNQGALAQDQCDTTLQCKLDFGERATDCKDSRSDKSICMCGSLPCNTDSGTDSNSLLIPALIEAEDFIRYFDSSNEHRGNCGSGPVDQQTTSDPKGGGCNIGWTAAGEWLEYDVQVNQGGKYDFDFRLASQDKNKNLNFSIDGNSVDNIVAPGKGWQKWDDVSVKNVQLNSGKHTLRVTFTSGSVNFNYFDVKKSGSNSGNNKLGFFNKNTDLLLLHFDLDNDLDDAHGIAGAGTMLQDARLQGVNFHAVVGTYSKRPSSFPNMNRLMNLAFSNNWSNAHTERNNALNTVVNKSLRTLRNGGDIWIAEGGESDFSADVLRAIKNQAKNINTKAKIHVVQHSTTNEKKSNQKDFNFVKSNTDYRKIPDGNIEGNGSSGFRTFATQYWGRATSDVESGAMWQEARDMANQFNGQFGRFDNVHIGRGGMDFSDTPEFCYIIGINPRGVKEFFDEFL